jgi:tetratricopeptide (TPR) repeat protein
MGIIKKNKPLKVIVPFRTKITLIIFGLFLCLVLIETGLRLGGFLFLSAREYRNMQSIKEKGTYRIICLGESTTTGQYPRFLEEALNQGDAGVRFSVIDKGISGIRTSAILSQVEYHLDNYNPDMVVTMMGINDNARHIPFEKDTTSKVILLMRSLKVYKLIRLLWLHILTKAEEIGTHKLNIEKHPFKENSAKLMHAEPIPYEDLLKKALELNPEDDRAYTQLVQIYRKQEKRSEAEVLLRKAIELNPENDWAYTQLGWIYREHGKRSEAEVLLRKAIELNPENEWAYAELGRIYFEQGKLPEAETLFKKAIELNPENDWVYTELGRIYFERGKLSEAIGLLKKAIEFNPENDWAHSTLVVLNEEAGKPELAIEYAKKTNELRSRYYNYTVAGNYLKLKEILDKRGIRLVCVQYPMRNIEPLKNIFRQDEGIVFVDNESIFKQAIQRAGRKEYFVDMFGGDFGHCTEKGNQLLAQNIADTILKEVFHE